MIFLPNIQPWMSLRRGKNQFSFQGIKFSVDPPSLYKILLTSPLFAAFDPASEVRNIQFPGKVIRRLVTIGTCCLVTIRACHLFTIGTCCLVSLSFVFTARLFFGFICIALTQQPSSGFPCFPFLLSIFRRIRFFFYFHIVELTFFSLNFK